MRWTTALMAWAATAGLAHAAGPRASSALENGEEAHGAELAFDGLLQTSWAEGRPGGAEGEWIELDLGRTTEIEGISIWPGRIDQGARSYRENGRPRTLTVLVDGEPVGEPVHLRDRVQRVDVPLHARGRVIRVVIGDVYEGYVFSDVHIAEIAVNYPKVEHAERLRRWLGSKEARRLAEDLDRRIEEAYQRYKDAEFGDREALAFLMDLAADGPDYLRPKVRALVPAGWRAAALESVEKAQLALRKLKDANAIPALRMAALRALGEEQERLEELVEVFEAWQELQGGGAANVPLWGASGWEPGALRGFGEPLAIEIDREGNLLVADTGNNRVQLFGPDGRVVRQWGGEPDITNSWFGEDRKWYVSGAAPGTNPGQWTQPLDVEVIPAKEGDLWAGLDALGRIQVFGPDGRLVISWTVETDERPEPRVGGEAYLCWVPRKQWLVAIIDDEAVAYTLDSEEVARWRVEDGTPNAAEVSKKGHLLLVFGPRVVRYEPDGFRYGTVMDGSVLGEGFEDMDLTLDEEGRLWVVTDAGWVYRFKKPGKKPDIAVQAIDVPLARHRIAVRDGIVYFTADDRIGQLDVLQYLADLEQRRKRGGDEAADEDALP